MTRQVQTPSAPRSREFKLSSPKLPPPDTAKHDEWLLDEALAETFPASDAIAVSPHSRASDERK